MWSPPGKLHGPGDVAGVSRYLTITEIATAWRVPVGTVRWLAHRDGWARSADGRRPVLYLIADVEKTMERRLDSVTRDQPS